MNNQIDTKEIVRRLWLGRVSDLTFQEEVRRELDELAVFLTKSCQQAHTTGRQEEHDRWANQPANEHDEKIRAIARQEVVEEIYELIDKKRHYDLEEFDHKSKLMSIGHNSALDDIISSLKDKI